MEKLMSSRRRCRVARSLLWSLLSLGWLGLGGWAAHASTYTVTNLGDSGTGGCTAAGIGDGCTLREAIAAANAAGGVQADIVFDATVFGSRQTIPLNGTALPPFINPSSSAPRLLTVTAPAAGVAVDGKTLSRIFQVNAGVTATFTGLTIADAAVSGSSGGGILNFGALTLEKCVLASNAAQNGGGVSNEANASLTVENSVFSSNSLTFNFGKGGALYNLGTLTVRNSSFGNNTAAFAAALYNTQFPTGAVALDSCTIAGNNGGDGGGIINDSAQAITLTNTLIANNNGNTGNRSQVAGSFSGSYDLISIGDGSGGLTNGVNHNQVGSNAAPIAAQITALGDHGGPTPTFALLANSPAFDAGATSLTTDQRGVARPLGAADDIGAFEFTGTQSGPNFVVTQTGDAGDGLADAAGTRDGTTLREAIAAANLFPNSVITFDPTVFAAPRKTIILGNSLPIANPLTIKAPAAGVVLQGSFPSGIFKVNATTLLLAGLTLSGSTGVINSGGDVTITNCTLQGTGTGSGLGAYSERANGNQGRDGTLAVYNSTVTNFATGVQVVFGTGAVRNCTVVGNSNGVSNAATLGVYNTILASNSTDVAGSLTADSHNLKGISMAQAGLDPNGLQENGGPTQTIALRNISRAINQGDNSLLPPDSGDADGDGNTGEVVPYDQRGPNFARVQRTTVDIGAYESAFDAVNNSLVVTTTADEDDGTSDPSFGTGTSLREAIEFANAYPGAAPITFNLPSGSTILLTSQLPALFDSVIGPGANQLTVRRSSADGTPSFGIFQVAASKTLTISGLTISNGNAGYGGGIYNAGNLTLTACVLSGNHADRGGAIYSAPPSGDATLFVRDCTFSGNTNGVGDPGFAYGGALFNYGTAVITNSTISGNNLFIPVNYNEAGSAIYNYGGPLTLDRCTVTNNGGTAQVVFSANGSASPITMRNSIIAGNQADTGTPTVDANFNLIGGTAQAAGLQTSTGVAILKNNGGPTPTVALRFGSPAIDAGDPNFDATNVPYDQRGVGFPRVFNNRLDIGAYEIQSVSNTAPTATGPTTFTATAGTGKTLTLVGGDVDNDPLSYTITTLPTNGILYDGPSTSGTAITTVPYTLTDPNHQVTYLAPTSYTGSDSFGFKVNDGTVDSNVQTVTGTVFPPVATTGAIISELRTRGPGGAGDEYVEIANTTSGPINVGGWFLAAPNGAAEATTTIPANTVIPKGGHLLFTGSTYSLTSYAVGDVTLTADLPDTGGVALRNGAGTPVDAVGFASAGALYKLGSGIAASIVGNGQNAFMRKQNGTPYVNSGDNASDFDFVAVTGGLVDGAAAKLGAPGPKSLSSPLLHNDILSAVALPVYRDTTAVGTNATYGTMAVRYKVTNNGSQTLTRLRFRAVMLPVGGAISGGTWQTSNGTADLRLLTSADTTATINGVSVPIKGSTLEEPPAQSNGGGLNSSMSLDLSGLAGGGLAAGASVNVQFNFGVVVKGTYRAVLNMEGLP